MGRAVLVGLALYLTGAISYRVGKEQGYVEWRYVNL